MHSNAWNLCSSKERLEIIERTEAHKKHLINIISAKTKIDSHNTLRARSPCSPINILRKKSIDQDNQSMVKRIMERQKSRNYLIKGSLSQVGRNLKTYSSVGRSLKQKAIEQQNGRMLSRLVTISPTIRRDQWIKRNIQTCKYKQNLHRSKYSKPDYSVQACKIMNSTGDRKFRCLNLNLSERKVGILQKSKIIERKNW